MKPGDHPDFFRLPAPPGRSRESTIVLDRYGRFSHDGEPVAHRGLHAGFASWIETHPDDGRFILSNGYDWCYVTVEDTAYFITGLSLAKGVLMVDLFDGTREPLALASLAVGQDGVLRARVLGGRFEARFTRAAQLMTEPFLAEAADGSPDAGLAIVVGDQRYAITAS